MLPYRLRTGNKEMLFSAMMSSFKIPVPFLTKRIANIIGLRWRKIAVLPCSIDNRFINEVNHLENWCSFWVNGCLRAIVLYNYLFYLSVNEFFLLLFYIGIDATCIYGFLYWNVASKSINSGTNEDRRAAEMIQSNVIPINECKTKERIKRKWTIIWFTRRKQSTAEILLVRRLTSFSCILSVGLWHFIKSFVRVHIWFFSLTGKIQNLFNKICLISYEQVNEDDFVCIFTPERDDVNAQMINELSWFHFFLRI